MFLPDPGRYSVRTTGGVDPERDAPGQHPVRPAAQRGQVPGDCRGVRTGTRLQDPVGRRPDRDRGEGRNISVILLRWLQE